MKSAVTTLISGFFEAGPVAPAPVVAAKRDEGVVAPQIPLPIVTAAALPPFYTPPPVPAVVRDLEEAVSKVVAVATADAKEECVVPDDGWVAAAKLQVAPGAPPVAPDPDATARFFKHVKLHLAEDQKAYADFVKVFDMYLEGKLPVSELVLCGERACSKNVKLAKEFRSLLPRKLYDDFDFYRKVHALSEVAFRFPNDVQRVRDHGAALDTKKIGTPEFVRRIGVMFRKHKDMQNVFRHTFPEAYRRTDVYDWAAGVVPTAGPTADECPPAPPGPAKSKSSLSSAVGLVEETASECFSGDPLIVIEALREELDEANELCDRNYDAWKDCDEQLKKRNEDAKRVKELTETLRLRDELITRMEMRAGAAKAEEIEEAVRARADQIAAAKVRALEVTNDILDKQIAALERKLKSTQNGLDASQNARKSRDAEFNALLAVKDRLKAENERYLTELERYAELDRTTQAEKKKSKTLVVVQTSQHANLLATNKNLMEAVKQIRAVADAERKRCEDVIADRESIKKRASTSDGKVAAAEARVSEALARVAVLEAESAQHEERRRRVERLEREVSVLKASGSEASAAAKAETKAKAKAAKVAAKAAAERVSPPPSPASSSGSAPVTPVKEVARDDECTICMERAFDSMVLPCCHNFCSACAAVQVGKTCHTCRGPVDSYFLIGGTSEEEE